MGRNMARVLIVAKTRMGKRYCLGGLVLKGNQPVRLLNPLGNNHHSQTRIDVGQVWNFTFKKHKPIEPPHMENVRILPGKKKVGRVTEPELRKYLLKKCRRTTCSSH